MVPSESTAAAGPLTKAEAADEAGISGAFDCGRFPLIGRGNKNVGEIGGVSGSFTASRRSSNNKFILDRV